MKPLLILTRTNIIESIHKGYICATNSDNQIIFNIGDVNTKVSLRSTAKPIQAIAFVTSGAMEKFNISLEELAVICSSHSAQDFHIEAVRSILKKIGLNEEQLSCGAAIPYNQDAANELVRKGESPSPLHNSCSGNHAGMLAVCRYYDFPIEGYYKAEHPMQKLLLKIMAELLACDEKEITRGIDGCSIPCFMITLKQAAYIYSLLAQGSFGENKYKDNLGMIQKAMMTYPRMINGDEEFCTDLIFHSGGRVIGKIGAEGIYCTAIPERHLGICVKIVDGNERGVYPVMTHILKLLEVLSDEELEKLKQWAYPPVKNHKGELVGYSIPIFTMNKAENLERFKIGERFNV